VAALLIPALVNYLKRQAMNGLLDTTSPDVSQALGLINTLQNPTGAAKAAITDAAKNAAIENIPLAADANNALQDLRDTSTNYVSDAISPVTNLISDQLQSFGSSGGVGKGTEKFTDLEMSHGGIAHLLRIMHNAKS